MPYRITGKGHHSHNYVTKIQPAVIDVCKRRNLKYYIVPDNSGAILIDLRKVGSYEGFYYSHYNYHDQQKRHHDLLQKKREHQQSRHRARQQLLLEQQEKQRIIEEKRQIQEARKEEERKRQQQEILDHQELVRRQETMRQQEIMRHRVHLQRWNNPYTHQYQKYPHESSSERHRKAVQASSRNSFLSSYWNWLFSVSKVLAKILFFRGRS